MTMGLALGLIAAACVICLIGWGLYLINAGKGD